MKKSRVLVTGAGGFIGHHLVRYLKKKRYWVRGADLKRPKWSPTEADQFCIADLRKFDQCLYATLGVDEVYNLAADMGGMGFISSNNCDILHNNSLINIYTIEASRRNGVKKYFFSSSACIYPTYRQGEIDSKPLSEDMAMPAAPQKGYGWEKLLHEIRCWYYQKERGLETRIARFHNTYGPEGEYEGGREKAPAALCRKVAFAEDGGSIDVWGDGKATRTYTYIDDCVEGIYRLMQSDYREPLNLGRDRIVSVDELAQLIIDISGKKLKIRHIDGPQGVRGRNSDNSLCKNVLDWEPTIPIETGIVATYQWIKKQTSLKN